MKLLARTEVIVPVVGVSVVHVQLAVVLVPVHVRDVAIRVTRPSVLPSSIHSPEIESATSCVFRLMSVPYVEATSSRKPSKQFLFKTVANRYR